MDNSSIKGLKRFLGRNAIVFFYNSLFFLSDRSFLKFIYRLRMGKPLNLSSPQTFNEKLQWLKLYNHCPQYTNMADKIVMRDYVKAKIGDGHTVPLLGVWDSFNDIDFDTLPNEFVLKTNHDSGNYIICRDKSSLDLKEAKKKMEHSLKRNYYSRTREWQYKEIKRKIFAEELLDSGNILTDYKFFCFWGKPEFMYIEKETDDNPSQAIFDMDLNVVPFSMDDEKTKVLPAIPSVFNEMAEMASKLSQDIPFLRVDMYYVKDTIYIGEVTFFHYGGFIPFNPPEWDYKIGEKLDISNLIEANKK